MNKLLFSAAMFAAITSAQGNDDDDIWMKGEIETSADFEGDMHSFDFFGDCIGLSPVVFGKEGQFVHSDIQYAQQVQEDVRTFSNHMETGKLDTKIAMELMTRFYSRDDSTDANGDPIRELIAAEIHLEEDLWLSSLVEDEMGPGAVPEDMAFMEEEFPRIAPMQHGHVFRNMFNPDDVMSMEGYVIASVLFDKRGFFSGFNLMEASTGDLMILSPLQAGDGRLNNVDNDMALIRGNKHTRLVGFRTTKRCSTAKEIMSVQPIYLSTDEDMCKNTLVGITRGMTQEITEFGPSCDEIDNSIFFSTTQNIHAPNMKNDEGRAVHPLQVAVTWATFLMVIILACIVVRDSVKRRSERAENKRAEQMRSTLSSAQPVVTEAPMMNADTDRRRIEDAVDNEKDQA